MDSDISIVLPLNDIDELFNAPDVNPFSTHEVDILGQSALVCIEKRVLQAVSIPWAQAKIVTFPPHPDPLPNGERREVRGF